MERRALNPEDIECALLGLAVSAAADAQDDAPPFGAAPLTRCAAIEMCSGQDRAESAPPQDPDAEPTTAGLYSRKENKGDKAFAHNSDRDTDINDMDAARWRVDPANAPLPTGNSDAAEPMWREVYTDAQPGQPTTMDGELAQPALHRDPPPPYQLPPPYDAHGAHLHDHIRLGTLNCCGLRATEKRLPVAMMCVKHRLTVLAVQKTHLDKHETTNAGLRRYLGPRR